MPRLENSTLFIDKIKPPAFLNKQQLVRIGRWFPVVRSNILAIFIIASCIVIMHWSKPFSPSWHYLEITCGFQNILPMIHHHVICLCICSIIVCQILEENIAEIDVVVQTGIQFDTIV